MNDTKIEILQVKFNTELSLSELPYFRGAVIKMVGQDNILFHNHQEEGFRYGYPLIQYKRIGGRASVLCIGNGAREIGHLLANRAETIELGKRTATLEVDDIKDRTINMQIWDTTFTYTIRKYLPFNQENYKAYQQAEGLAEKTILLEKCLTGNILSMAKGLGVFFDSEVIVKVTEIEHQKAYRYKGIMMQAFDLKFKCNVSLPIFIGLGKGVSLGYGTIIKTT